MKNFRAWPAVSVAAAIALSACGGSGDSSSSDVSLRVANATLTHSSLSLLVNTAASGTPAGMNTVNSYVSTGSGSVTLQLNDATSGASLSTNVATLSGGLHYTIFAYESGGAVKTVILNEDNAVPAAGSATLRFQDAAAEAGKLDVYVIAGTDCSAATLGATTPQITFTGVAPFTAALTQGVGNWNICVTGSGSKTDLRMAMPVSLTSQQIVTAVLAPAVGGQLLNGALLVQQGAYSATPNTNSRVRLAAAVAGGTIVTATTGTGVVIDSGKSPAFGYYALVPSTSTLNVTTGSGSSVGSVSGLTPGGDSTLLVYGNASAPTTTLIADDNRAPSDSTTIKVRTINGVNGGVGSMTLTANNSPIGINLAPGTASTYSSVQGATSLTATAITFTLSSSTAGTYPTYANTLNTSTAYTVLIGDPSAAAPSVPQLLIR